MCLHVITTETGMTSQRRHEQQLNACGSLVHVMLGDHIHSNNGYVRCRQTEAQGSGV